MKYIKQLLAYFGFQYQGKPSRLISRVGRTEIRRLFNDGLFVQRVASGELVAVLNGQSHTKPENRPANCPHCTHSQEYTYRDPVTNEDCAIVHCYRRPDGTIGASGQIDPHMVIVAGVEYHEPRVPKGALTPKRNLIRKLVRKAWRKLKFRARQVRTWLVGSNQ